MVQRTNDDWLAELTGDRGYERQILAHKDLGRYLHRVALTYLEMRQDNVAGLAGFSWDELETLAQDFVQDTLERLVQDHCAVLRRFRGDGAFTSYAAQIVRRQVAQELRRPYWQRRVFLKEPEVSEDDTASWQIRVEFEDTDPFADPEKTAICQQVGDVLQHCIEGLSARRRDAFWYCEVEGRSAGAVAHFLQSTTNAIYQLVLHAKRDLRDCLRKHKLDASVLENLR